MTDLLIENGADLNIRDEHGNPSIWTAIFNAKGDFTIVHKLYKADADIDTKISMEDLQEIWKKQCMEINLIYY